MRPTGASAPAVAGLAVCGLCRAGLLLETTDNLSQVPDQTYPWSEAEVEDPLDMEADVTRELNFSIHKGATFSKSFRFKQPSTGDPVDLTGATAVLQARTDRDPDATHVVTIASYPQPVGGPSPWYATITIEEALGSLSIDLTNQQTGDLAAGEYPYAFEIHFAGGQVRRYFEGVLTIVETAIEGVE